MGVPPAGLREQGDNLIADVVREYGAGKKELSRDDFEALFRDMLTDIAARLEAEPIVVGHQATVLNGSRLRRLLDNPEQFEALADDLFKQWDVRRKGRLSCKELTAGLRNLGPSLGLPPPMARDSDAFFKQLFVSADMDESGFVDRKEMGGMLRGLFEQLAKELKEKPVILECNVIAM
eukprot:TRINITY_DN29480_c0_g2_i1.p2 TRINITY_DN29480_c0_g2~~TRINITY_DN29480_c0_g2_i1.p2  ORF type:complete len:209 (+),score=20.47 TRINITY_DN29480_c0_g2_i1:96-629(+)